LLELRATPDGLLDPITLVVETAVVHADGLTPNDVMVVGAWCRDILHSALGHSFATTATLDLDLALALSSWDTYRSLASAQRSRGSASAASGSASRMSTSTCCRSVTSRTRKASSTRPPAVSR
jgi:predicted nucleotidyltransferase